VTHLTFSGTGFAGADGQCMTPNMIAPWKHRLRNKPAGQPMTLIWERV
jgi:hypothetical protein